MKATVWKAALVMCWLIPVSITCQAQLNWRISVKFILDTEGKRPTSGILDTDQEVHQQIDEANGVLDSSGRGYRFKLTGPYKQLDNGIDAASPGDIVLIRPRTYSGSYTVTKAITFRATRGNAIIGPP